MKLERSDIIEIRICSKCKKEYPATDEYFYKNKCQSKKRGIYYNLSCWCKECHSKNSKTWALNNREKTLQYKKKHNALEYRKLSKREISKQRRLDGKYKQYQQDHPEKFKEYNNKRQNKNHDISKESWQSCKQYFDYSCAYCGMLEEEHLNEYKQQLHKEHVDHEGANDLSNCVPSCKECNSKKWEFSLVEWYNEDNPRFTYERLNKINKWISEDWKLFYVERQKRKNKKIQ